MKNPTLQRDDRPRPRRRPRHEHRSRSRTRSSPRTARARSRRSTRRTTSTRSSWSSIRSSSGPRTRSRMLYVRAASGTARAARRRREARARRRPAGRQPLRAAPLGDDLVQPRARRLARRGGGADQRRGQDHVAVDDHHQLPGDRAGVPVVAPGPGAAAAHGHRRDLHGPGHPLRELHPPADDSLGAAVRRLRRAADAAGLPAPTCRSTPLSASSCWSAW